jgi:DNA-binding SARP family transcriptional activator/tetratricopeptide (TPR) repeat protein
MHSVRITTLGGLGLSIDGQQVDWLSSQRMRAACLVFLAVEREVSRDRLVGVFWPDAELDRGRHALSQTIYTIRRSLGDDAVVTEGDRVRIAPHVDVDVINFTRAADRGDFDDALQHYRGRFLADTALAGSVEFDQWIDSKRALIERLHRRVRREAIEQLTAGGDRAAALRLAREWCDLEPDDDEAHHSYIVLLIELGQRAEAIRHFEDYRDRLRASDLEPLNDTTALIASIRAKQPEVSVQKAITSRSLRMPQAELIESPQPSGIHHLIAELKRRRVTGAMAFYLVLAWGAIEVSNTIFPLLGLPEWGPKLIVWIALLGIPVTIFLAWEYDFTAHGVQRTPSPLISAGALPRMIPRWVTLGVIMMALMFGLFKVYNTLKPGHVSGPLAIFPFCAAGDASQNDAEDIAVLLAGKVDAIPELRTTDPNYLIPAFSAAKIHCRDAPSAGALARKMRAGRFLLGSVTRVGNETRADARLYDVTTNRQKWAITTNVRSGPYSLVVDSLFKQILEQQGLATGDRLMTASATATQSQPALEAWLEGEREMRAVRWRKATDAYQRAVQIDSTFALAWMKLAISIWSWGGPYEQRMNALAHAHRFAAKLAEREQRLLRAVDAAVRGAVAEAFSQVETYLDTYPDDPQAWALLGAVEIEWGGFLGHGFDALIKADATASRLQNGDATFMLAWDYWEAYDYARSDSVTKLALATGAGGEWVIGLEAVRAYRSKDEKRIQEMLARIDAKPADVRHGSLAWPNWAGNYELWERVGDRALAQAPSAESRSEALWNLIEVRYGRGKLSALGELLERAAEQDPARVNEFRARIALNPVLPKDTGELRALRAALETASSNGQPRDRDIIRKMVSPDAENIRRRANRLYLQGRLSVVLGDFKGADAFADLLRKLPERRETPTENANLALAIRAHLAVQSGDTALALKRLDSISPQKPFFVLGQHYGAETVLRAEILIQQRRFADAARWYSRAGIYEAHDFKRRGELAERLGRRAEAAEHYRRMTDLLAECDPVLFPLRRFAERRLAALGG